MTSPPTSADTTAWQWIKCERCGKKNAIEYLPLDMLGKVWWELVPEKSPSSDSIGLCGSCYAIARSAEGRIMGYKTVRGWTRKYVKEELFGELPPDTP